MLRQNLVTKAGGFYAGMAALAILWCVIAGRPIFWIGDPPTLGSILGWGVVGVLGGAGVVVLSNAVLDRYAWAQSLSDWFAEMLGPITWREALFLALLSGFAEEMLFRGAMQPTLGLIPTTIIFGLLHWPPRADLRPWTVMTMVLGLLFGLAAETSGHLTAPIVAHFVINFVNLTAIGKMARD